MFYQNIDFRNLGNTSFLHIIFNLVTQTDIYKTEI